MKRLLDESTDELTRSLLQAGVEHRPPDGNKRQLIVAMGAGGALGLFSSNAFAWLGTTAGKVTAAGVAVGVAGAVFVAGPLLSPSDASHAPEQVVSAARPSIDPSANPDVVPSAEVAETRATEPAVVEEPGNPRDVLQEATASAEPDVAEAESEPAASEPPLAVGTSERSVASTSASRKKAQSLPVKRAGKKASGRKARASASQRKTKKAVETDAVATTAGTATPAAPEKEAPDARRAALDAEVRLVDEMHGAARRDDREALARLVAAYRAEFPDGQLKKEVADFEASLEQPELR